MLPQHPSPQNPNVQPPHQLLSPQLSPIFLPFPGDASRGHSSGAPILPDLSFPRQVQLEAEAAASLVAEAGSLREAGGGGRLGGEGRGTTGRQRPRGGGATGYLALSLSSEVAREPLTVSPGRGSPHPITKQPSWDLNPGCLIPEPLTSPNCLVALLGHNLSLIHPRKPWEGCVQ